MKRKFEMKKFLKHSAGIFGIVMLGGIPLWVPLAIGTGFLIKRNEIMDNFKNSQSFKEFEQKQVSIYENLQQKYEQAQVLYENGTIKYEDFFDARAKFKQCEATLNSSNFVFQAMEFLDEDAFHKWTEYNGNLTKSYVFGGTVGALVSVPYTFVICHRRVEKWKTDEQAQAKDPHLFDKI